MGNAGGSRIGLYDLASMVFEDIPHPSALEEEEEDNDSYHWDCVNARI